MEPIELIEKSTAYAQKVVDGIKPVQLADSTPCAELDVKGVLNHLFGGHTMLIQAAQTGTGTLTQEDLAAGNLSSTYADLRVRLIEAFSDEGVLGKTLTMPFGAMPGAMIANLAFLEALVHGWDLARATKQDVLLDPVLAQTCLDTFKPMGAMLRGPGVFGPEIQIAEDAPIGDRLIAFTGRQP